MAFIDVKNLNKTYKLRSKQKKFSLFKKSTREIQAVKDISFQIEQGEMVGYIGKNGAGKSTTIKVLSGILVPSAGHVEVKGIVPYQNRIKNAKNIGVVFGQRSQLFWDLPVIDSFIFLKKLYQIPHETYAENMQYFQEYFQLDELLDRPVRKLSLGQKMKCEICAALLHSPEILYLDEPTIGLDILTKQNVREFIKKVNQSRGTTVILTTHDIADIEQLCSRIILIDQGEKMYDGSIDGIQSHLQGKRLLEVKLEQPFTGQLVQVEQLQVADRQLNFVIDLNQVSISEVIQQISSTNVISDLTVHKFNLEQLLVDYYQNQQEEGLVS